MEKVLTTKILAVMEGHPKREQLGIFASPRATMYVDGEWHNFDIDEIPSLAKKGTDVVFIEKRGVVEIVKYIGDIYGIAFFNTQGHFAEYPKDLIREINQNGGNVAILTDFDCAGIHIAEKVIADDEYREEISEDTVFELKPPYEIIDASLAPPEKQQHSEHTKRVVRLGIDVQTLEYFVSKNILVNDNTLENLKSGVEKMSQEVGEEYPKHTDPKKQQPGKNAKRYDSYLRDPTNPKVLRYKRYEYIYNNFEYLTGISIDDLHNEDTEGIIGNRKTARRIEIDSVIEAVKAPAFAQFILEELQEFFPERNYNRIIKPLIEYFGDKFDILPEGTKKLLSYVTSVADTAAKPIKEDIESEQEVVTGLLNVSDRKEENKKRISKAVAQDTEMKKLDSKLVQVYEQLTGSGNNNDKK
jgi:hypothetical protein